MNIDVMAKIEYAKIMTNRPRKYNGSTMLHLLIYYRPKFMESEEYWVDKLF